MDERYTESFINSVDDYLYNLQYLAISSPITLRSLHLFQLVKQVYDLAPWYEVSEANKITLQKQMEKIVLGNSKLTMIPITTGIYYSNVSSAQTIYTWQRVYDNPQVNTMETIYGGDILDEETGNPLQYEDGSILQFEY